MACRPCSRSRPACTRTSIASGSTGSTQRARPGDLVAVRLSRTVAGYGHFNPRAEITVRLLSSGPEPPGEAFWSERLAAAVALRRDLLGLDAITDAYRLIHSEGDGLSGIVVDKLGDVLSAEAFSLGMYQRSADLLERLARLTGARGPGLCGPGRQPWPRSL